MTWFKVDDSFYDHPKVEQLSLAARGLWVTAGSYAARHLTDGFVPDNILKRVGKGVPAASRELHQQGLWRVVPGGIQFHDWEQFQPSRENVEQERSRTKQRQQAWRDRKRNGVTNASRNGVINAARGDGAPTRPDPTLSPPTPSRTEPPAPADSPADAGERGKPNGHSPARQLAATLLGIDQDSPQLDNLPAILASHNVRTPAAWLRTAAANGDLAALLEAPAADTDPWSHLPVLNPKPTDWHDERTPR